MSRRPAYTKRMCSPLRTCVLATLLITLVGLRPAIGADGVEGVLDRSVDLEDLRAGCERVLAGQRVLAGNPLAVLASAGLELTEAEPEPTDDGGSLLTRKEMEVLAELGRHSSNREIAAAMHVSSATVKTHLSNIYAKLGVSGRREAVLAAVERGLLS